MIARMYRSIHARTMTAASITFASLAAGCATNAPYEPSGRATPAATRPALTAGVDPTAASAAIAEAQPPLAPNVAIPPAPEPTATQPSSAGEPRTHAVARGETFYSIAKTYYGSGARWTAIRDANPGVAPERLPVGKTIIVP